MATRALRRQKNTNPENKPRRRRGEARATRERTRSSRARRDGERFGDALPIEKNVYDARPPLSPRALANGGTQTRTPRSKPDVSPSSSSSPSSPPARFISTRPSTGPQPPIDARHPEPRVPERARDGKRGESRPRGEARHELRGRHYASRGEVRHERCLEPAPRRVVSRDGVERERRRHDRRAEKDERRRGGEGWRGCSARRPPARRRRT